jgi:hypothetical protein
MSWDDPEIEAWPKLLRLQITCDEALGQWLTSHDARAVLEADLGSTGRRDCEGRAPRSGRPRKTPGKN